MAETSAAEAKAILINSFCLTPRLAKRVANYELLPWDLEELRGLLEQLNPLPKKVGTSDPCGPSFNIYSGMPKTQVALQEAIRYTAIAMFAPVQLGVGGYLLRKGKFKAIKEELPRPTQYMLNLAKDYMTYVKAPRDLILESIRRREALCVNSKGQFQLMTTGYTVVSHVWGETMGWQSETGWGPVEVSLREKGMVMDHLKRIHERCEADWIWLDVLAMPEALPGMSAAAEAEIDAARIAIINCLNQIYQRADKVMILDTLLLRLSTGSMIDAACILCLSRWITRLWPFTESRLAKKVVLKTADSSFDLDTIIDYIARKITNEQHRYFNVLNRLTPLRPTPEYSQRLVRYPGQTSAEPHILLDIYHGTEDRFTDVVVDHARALFPVLGLKWQVGWSVHDGLRHIRDSFPQEAETVDAYMQYREHQIG